jgi:hypothetical protein
VIAGACLSATRVDTTSRAFTLNLSTDYGAGLWLTEPRRSLAKPGPVPGLDVSRKISAAGQEARLIAPYPGIPRLWFVQFSGDVQRLMASSGRPIHYGYVQGEYDLTIYQTLFSAYPGSAEMPSAAYPFTRRVLDRLQRRGVKTASIVLHTGVSSLEVESENLAEHVLYPEPYWVPRATAEAVNAAHLQGRRIIALGTTVVRALESAFQNGRVKPEAARGQRPDHRTARSGDQPSGDALRAGRTRSYPHGIRDGRGREISVARVWRQPFNTKLGVRSSECGMVVDCGFRISDLG